MAGVVGFTWEGADKARATFVRMGAMADAIARENVQHMSMELIKLAQDNFRGSHAKGKPHVPTPKNPLTGSDYPNIVTGNLRRSIQSQGVNMLGPGLYTATVGPTAKYGRRVELGYKNVGRPFPFFGPASHQVRARAEAIAWANWAEVWRA